MSRPLIVGVVATHLVVAVAPVLVFGVWAYRANLESLRTAAHDLHLGVVTQLRGVIEARVDARAAALGLAEGILEDPAVRIEDRERLLEALVANGALPYLAIRTPEGSLDTFVWKGAERPSVEARLSSEVLRRAEASGLAAVPGADGALILVPWKSGERLVGYFSTALGRSELEREARLFADRFLGPSGTVEIQDAEGRRIAGAGLGSSALGEAEPPARAPPGLGDAESPSRTPSPPGFREAESPARTPPGLDEAESPSRTPSPPGFGKAESPARANPGPSYAESSARTPSPPGPGDAESSARTPSPSGLFDGEPPARTPSPPGLENGARSGKMEEVPSASSTAAGPLERGGDDRHPPWPRGRGSERGPLSFDVGAADEMVDAEGRAFLRAAVAAPELGWWILAARPRATALASIDRLARQIAWLACVAALIACIVGVLLARSISQPITRLAMAVRLSIRGGLREGVPERGALELIELSRGFNRAVEALARQRRQLLSETRLRLRLARYLTAEEIHQAVSREHELDEPVGPEKIRTVLVVDVVPRDEPAVADIPVDRLVLFLGELYSSAAEIIERHGGLFHDRLGDEVVGLFVGDDPEVAASAAVRAARDILERGRSLSARWTDALPGSAALSAGVVSAHPGEASPIERAALFQKAAPAFGILADEPTRALVREPFGFLRAEAPALDEAAHVWLETPREGAPPP